MTLGKKMKITRKKQSESTESQQLSRRERQIMDILYEGNELSAHDIRKALPDPPGYSAVRAMLAKLLDKNIIKHREDGPRYLYSPVIKRDEAKIPALQKLVKTFFSGSTVDAVNALLGMQSDSLSDKDIEKLEKTIQQAKQKNKST